MATHPMPSATLKPAPPQRRLADLPGPRGLPLFGQGLQLRSERIHLQFEQWARQYGPYVRLRLGPRQVLLLSDPQTVAETLRDRPDGFGRTSRLEEMAREMGLPIGVFGASGDVWRRQRRMVMAGFDPGHVRHYLPAMQQVATRLAHRWHRAATEGRAIDLQADLMRYTVDTIAGLAFGAEVHTLESDHDVIQQHLDKILPALFRRAFAPFPTWRWFPSAADRELKHSVAEVLQAVQGFIAQARQRMQAQPLLRQQPDNLLEAMLAAADQPGSGMDDAQVAGNVLTMLLAGEDTTANTLAWMLYLLWRHPQALARAQAQVRELCRAGEVPSLAQLEAMDWLDACAHETMRLKPVAPQIPLQALRPGVVGDVQVGTGCIVICMMRVASVSEDQLPEAARFLPERWLQASAQDPQSARRLSMPFGAGPRICPGRYLALLEMKMAMATILNTFDIQGVATADGHAPREHMAFTMAPVGLRLHVELRR